MLTKVADSADYGLKLPLFVRRQTNVNVYKLRVSNAYKIPKDWV